MGILWPLSNQMVFDNNGIRAPAAKAYFYEAGTSTPKAVYEDGDESTVHTDPVVADGNGRWPAVFVPYGNYKYRITTALGSAIGDTIDDIPNPAPVDEEFSVDELQLLATGDVIFSFKDGERSGFVRCNGRTIGSSTSGAVERANADCEALFTFLWNNFSDTICPVSAGRGANAATDWGANKTITLHDARGALLGGLADMGSTDAGHYNPLVVPVIVGDGVTGGSTLGSNSHQLTTAQLASHTHTLSATTGAGSAHGHGLSAGSTSGVGDHTHSVSGTAASDGSHTHTGTTDNGGVDHTHNYDKGALAPGSQGASGANLTTSYTGTASSGASAFLHTHTFTSASGGSHTHSLTGTAAAAGSHSHTLVGSTDNESAHTHTLSGTSAASGGAGFHNNLPRTVIGTVLMKL